VVKVGDIVAQVETDTLAAQVKQAEAGLQAAQLRYVRMQEGSRPEEITAAATNLKMARTALASASTPTDDQKTGPAANMAKTEAALKLAQHEYDKIAYAGQVGVTPQALALEQATLNYQQAVAAYNMTVKPTDGQLAPLENQVAQAQLKMALTQKPYTETDLAAARATVEQAQAAVELAKTQLGYATMRAPFDGVVAEVYTSKGSLVGPQAPVALLVSDNVEVVVNVEESRIGQIQKGQNASLRVPAYPDRDFPAVITTVPPAADSKTHSFAVRVAPADGKQLLRSGMYADLAILAQEKNQALLVPRSAVTQVKNQPAVWVVTGDVAQSQPVTTGLLDADRVEILSGLKPGDAVVTAGQPNLTDGAKVQVVKNG
jgi:HlyD family secretion protein